MARALSLLTIVVNASVVAGVLAGCGGGTTRSASAFCSHYAKDKANYLKKYNAEAAAIDKAGNANPLVGLLGIAGMSAQMLGSVDDMFTDLAKVAPDEIQTQVEQVRDSIKKQENMLAAQNPLSAGSILSSLLGSLMTSLETSSDWKQVGDYITSTCHTT